MLAYLVDNIANIIVGLILAGIVFVCIRSIIKSHKSGYGCAGCTSCKSGSCMDSCTHYGEKLNIK